MIRETSLKRKMSTSQRKLRRKSDDMQPGNKMQVSRSQFSYNKGPLPLASELVKYNEACPGAADRIIAMAERQSEHRQVLEKTVVKSQTRNSLFGVIFAFIICVVTVIAGAYCVYNGSGWPGAALGLGGLASICGVFIYGTNNAKPKKD